jgi:hypothetical protein
MAMTTNNAVPAPPPVDFNAELKRAADSGNYAPILEMAKATRRMLSDFKDAISLAKISGRDAPALAMGIGFLDQLMAQSSRQIEDLTKKVEEADHNA